MEKEYYATHSDGTRRSYLFRCLGAEGIKDKFNRRDYQFGTTNLELHTVTTQELMTSLEDIFATTRIISFGRFNFICRKQKKTENLEQFHADSVELADCGDCEDEWIRDVFTAHMNN